VTGLCTTPETCLYLFAGTLRVRCCLDNLLGARPGDYLESRLLMLTNRVEATPRPPPPAKARRASSKSTPPPPYVATSDVSRNEPSMLSRTADWERLHRDIPLSSPVTEDWLNGHSRRNLAQLLSKAGEVIREREAGMSHASYT
jgi:hypothetical protein